MVIHLVPVVEATASSGLGISLILNFPHHFNGWFDFSLPEIALRSQSFSDVNFSM